MGTIGNPIVVTGAKGPRDLSMLPSADAAVALETPKENEVIFRSRYRHHTVVLKPEVRKIIADEVYTEQARKAVFENFVFRTSDPWTIAAIKASPRFGLHGDFWDQTEANEVALEAQYQQFVEALEANPKLKARLMVDANLKDFRLPARPIGGSAGNTEK